MIYVIRAVTFIFLVYGFYRLGMFYLKLPSLRTYKVAHILSRVNKGAGAFSLFIQHLTTALASKIKLGVEKRSRLTAQLRYADEKMTPEAFVASRIVQALMIALPAVVTYFIFPIASIVFIFIALVAYFQSGLRLEHIYNTRRNEIEYELPRFCATITQEIKNSRDVLGLLERYVGVSGKGIKQELEVTIADMKSSNYESALIRLESRMSIGAVSDIVRGLIGVIRGDDVVSYFEMLSHDMDAIELQRLEDEAGKQPHKIKKYQFFILVAMMLMYIVTIAVYLLSMDRPAFL